MSLRPIDMTITVQRTSDMNRSQTGEGVRPEVAHQQVSDKINREVQQQDQQVTQTHKSEEGKVDRDGRGNSGGSSSGRKKKENRSDKSKSSSAPGDSFFDVSV